MQVLDVDRVLVATEDVTETANRLNELLGIRFGTVFEEDGLESCIARDNSKLDLFAPKTETETTAAVRSFLDSHGPGLYGLALQVDDVEAGREELAEKGIEPAYVEEQHEFREYFYHPDHFEGILLAISEYPHSVEMNTKIAKGMLDAPDGES